jgi:acyl carrier protein
MADTALLADLVAIVRRVGKVPAERPVEPETRLVDDLGIDSLDLVAVFLTVQDTYGVVIDDDDIPRLARVADLAAYVARHRGTVAA